MAEPRRVKQVVDEIMGRLPKEGIEEIRDRWKSLLGQEIALHSAPVSVREGKLSVVVDSSTWLQHMTINKKIILAKLQQDTFYESVVEIRFKQGKI